MGGYGGGRKRENFYVARSAGSIGEKNLTGATDRHRVQTSVTDSVTTRTLGTFRLGWYLVPPLVPLPVDSVGFMQAAGVALKTDNRRKHSLRLLNMKSLRLNF